MLHTAKVCIMIPCFNQSGYIIKAVESALAQDYPLIEIVVADDNSTDNTAVLLQPYIKSNRIKYIKNQVNLGRVKNYHSTLQQQTDADWMINLDADDYYSNNKFISEAIAAIQKSANSGTVLFYQGTHIIKKDGSEIITKSAITAPQFLITGEAYFFNYFINKHFSHMATLYNRKLALQSGFYEKNILSADMYSILKLCINYSNLQVILSNNIAGIWLQHNTNSSKTLSFNEHYKNLTAFINLYNQAVAKGFNKPICRKWLITAVKTYLLTYTNTVLKSIKNIFK